MNNLTLTPQEKATELVNKCYSIITGMELSFISKLIVLPSGDSNYESAKQCALIGVDEILNNNCGSYMSELEIADKNEIYCDEQYWKSVKDEIQNL